jgi:hypothetical protein
VYRGRPGPIGKAILDAGGALRFGADGSGLLDVHRMLQSPNPLAFEAAVVTIPIDLAEVLELPAPARALAGPKAPCIVGHAGDHMDVLVTAKSLRRSHGTISDIRGKVRFGAARLDWEIVPS